MSLPQKVPNHGGREGNWSVVTNPAILRLISDETYRTYGQTLSEYSDNSIDENKWVIPFADGIRRTAVSFENLDISIEEMRLVKTYIIHTLSFYLCIQDEKSKVAVPFLAGKQLSSHDALYADY